MAKRGAARLHSTLSCAAPGGVSPSGRSGGKERRTTLENQPLEAIFQPIKNLASQGLDMLNVIRGGLSQYT